MIGEDEGGKFWIMLTPHKKHAGPYGSEGMARKKAKPMGLDGRLVRVAGRETEAPKTECAGDVMAYILDDVGAEVIDIEAEDFLFDAPNLLEEATAEPMPVVVLPDLATELGKLCSESDLLEVLDDTARGSVATILASEYTYSERADLLKFERAGKNRKTVLRALGVSV